MINSYLPAYTALSVWRKQKPHSQLFSEEMIPDYSCLGINFKHLLTASIVLKVASFIQSPGRPQLLENVKCLHRHGNKFQVHREQFALRGAEWVNFNLNRNVIYLILSGFINYQSR